MEYRIETKEAFRVVGVSTPLDREMENNFKAVPRLWEDAVATGALEKLAARMDGEPRGLLGVCACGEGEDWRYYIAVSSTQERGEFEEYTVPAATWAIFPGSGSNLSIQELERRVLTEWLPTSGYEYGNGPDIEVYLNPDPQDARYELWLPVTKVKS